jgi:hypothetical protein
MSKKGKTNKRAQYSDKRWEKAKRAAPSVEESVEVGDVEIDEEDANFENEEYDVKAILSTINICMWEFGQNDPKRFV